VTSSTFSQYTMKVFLFGILLALGACANGKPAPAEPADIGVVDCDALKIVMNDLISLNKNAKDKKEEADEEAEEKEEEAEEKAEEAKEKPKMRQQDEEEEDPKKVEEMLKESLDSLPPSTNANVKALIKELGPLFKLAQTGDLTDYDVKKAFADTVKAAGLNTEDAMVSCHGARMPEDAMVAMVPCPGLADQCPNLFDDEDNEGEDNEGEDNEGEDNEGEDNEGEDYDEDEPEDYDEDEPEDYDEDEDDDDDGKGNQ